MDRKSDSDIWPRVTRRALFLAFLEIGLSGFGGVLPWARRVLVDRRGWLTEKEFIEVLSIGQALPGPNIINASVAVGARFHGAVGAILAFSGLTVVPLVIVLMLAVLYAHFGHVDSVRRVLAGVAAGAAGLVFATGLKMANKLPRHWTAMSMMMCAFVSAGFLHLPLLAVLAVVAPISVFLAGKRRQ